MHPKERLQEDLKAAMKSGDTARRDVIRLLQSALKQKEVDERVTLSEEQVIALLMTEAKRRRESIAEAQAAGRTAVVEQETFELGVIESYLPKQLTREEIEAEVRKAMAETGVTTAKQQGELMKVLMPRVKGRADGKLVNDVVKALLNG
jgi:uncharacterized protein YqeY